MNATNPFPFSLRAGGFSISSFAMHRLTLRCCAFSACLSVSLQRALEEARKIVDEYTAWKADAPVREAERAAKESAKMEDGAADAEDGVKKEEAETEEENEKKRKRKAQRAEKILSVLS